jgi:hypothetical protein
MLTLPRLLASEILASTLLTLSPATGPKQFLAAARRSKGHSNLGSRRGFSGPSGRSGVIGDSRYGTTT